jgi:hypothetical protein
MVEAGVSETAALGAVLDRREGGDPHERLLVGYRAVLDGFCRDRMTERKVQAVRGALAEHGMSPVSLCLTAAKVGRDWKCAAELAKRLGLEDQAFLAHVDFEGGVRIGGDPPNGMRTPPKGDAIGGLRQPNAFAPGAVVFGKKEEYRRHGPTKTHAFDFGPGLVARNVAVNEGWKVGFGAGSWVGGLQDESGLRGPLSDDLAIPYAIKLSLSEKSGLRKLPTVTPVDFLEIENGGNLSLDGVRAGGIELKGVGLRRIGPKVTFETLKVEACPALESVTVAEGLRVNQLVLARCGALERLTGTFVVTGKVDLDHLPALTALDAGLRLEVGAECRVNDCGRLETIPFQMETLSSLHVSACRTMGSLQVPAAESVWIGECPCLGELTVGDLGDLRLDKLPTLRHLTLTGDLDCRKVDIDECGALETIAGGRIQCEDFNVSDVFCLRSVDGVRATRQLQVRKAYQWDFARVCLDTEGTDHGDLWLGDCLALTAVDGNLVTGNGTVGRTWVFDCPRVVRFEAAVQFAEIEFRACLALESLDVAAMGELKIAEDCRRIRRVGAFTPLPNRRYGEVSAYSFTELPEGVRKLVRPHLAAAGVADLAKTRGYGRDEA